jgi:hypothetical protein
VIRESGMGIAQKLRDPGTAHRAAATEEALLVAKFFLESEGLHFMLAADPVLRAISSVVERLLHTQEVAGSNPASRTIQSLALFGSDSIEKHVRTQSYAQLATRR